LKKDKGNLKEIISHRLTKLNNIKDNGYLIYPYKYDRSHKINEILNISISTDDKFSIAGRIISLRKMGKTSFFHIQDMTDKIQLYIQLNNLPDDKYDHIVRNLDIGDIIGCCGNIFFTKTNELSLKVYDIDLLAKNIRPLPNLKEKDGIAFNQFEDKELRYRHRHLDLIANPEVKNTFIKRAKIISSIRSYLDKNEFIEVETPVLQSVYGGASAKPFTTFHNSLNQEFFLRIADELYLKRLIIGGFDKVYEISKNFRNEGIDKNHNPEFTSLEFYQAYADLYDMIEITESIIKYIAKKNNINEIKFGKFNIDIVKPFRTATIFDLLKKYSEKDLSKMETGELIEFAKYEKNIDIDEKLNYGQILDKLFSDLVEPNLIQPIFVTDYPKSISPLAKIKRNGSNNIVERFELFIGGMEIANSFSELNDPLEQRNRLEAQVLLKDQGDQEAQIIDENYIQAMEAGMPPTGGVGIGIDRLIMLLTNSQSIKDVIIFPTLKNED